MARFENDETKSHPLVTELGVGTYYWCQCGKTRTVPYCDGSHRGTLHSPLKVAQVEAGEVKLCGCKQSATKPYCDCTHEKL